MDFLTNIAAIAFLMLMAAMAPGPDFALAVRNAVAYSRRTGVLTALGFALGVCVHATYCILGIAALISKSILIFNVLKYVGAAYLIYLGIQALRASGHHGEINTHINAAPPRDLSIFAAIGSGFVTNILNPKATMFFLSLFTQVIDPHTPVLIQMVYVSVCFFVVFGWFSFVALVLTQNRVKNIFLGFSKWIDRVCGVAMIAFGLRLAFSKINPVGAGS
jgi:RhtB (resistance to homoserine/threonine) family protein